MISLAALALAATSFGPAQDATAILEWEELGPAPISGSLYTGRVSAVACSPTDRLKIFVGGADGGVWRTENGGGAWTPLLQDGPTLSVGAIAIAPSDEDIVYVGTGEANYANHSRYGLGVLKTTDGGATWEHLAESTFAGRTFSRIVVHPTDPNVVYAAVGRAGGFPELAAAKGHPAATGPRGLFKSIDGGVTWTHLTNGLPNLAGTDVAMSPTDPDTLYAGIGRIFGAPGNGVYRTTNGGASWTKLGGGLPGGTLGRISLAVAPSDASRVYALVTNPASSNGGGASTRGAYRSDNGGNTWTSIPVTSGLQASYGWYLSVVTVKPTDPDTVFMGGLSFVRSRNAGATWSTVTPPHVDLHAAEWDASGRLVVGDDGGVHRTNDEGSSWNARNAGLGLIQLYAGLSTHPTNDEQMFGGFQDNGSNRRTFGTSWTQVFGGDGGWTQLDQAAPNRVFVEFQGTGNIYRSTGGGFFGVGSGISFSDRNCFLPPYLIEARNSNRMLYATQRIYRSTNGGSTWTPISADLSNGAGAVRALAQSPTDPLFVYAATNDGNVLRSLDGGSTWTTVLTGHPGWPRTTRELFVHPRRPQTVYLATASYGVDQVRVSTDSGTTWTSLDGDLPDVPTNVVAAVPRGPFRPPVLFAGTDQGLFHSVNGGVNWQRYGRGLPHAVVVDLAVEVGRGRIVAATQGRGVWRAPLILDESPR
ncbi:MAG: hypothetical protein AAF957_08575 [Planctomycetota bacterium]